MVEIHVWMPDANHVGHTAMTVKGKYISFWPDGEADKKDLKIKRSQPGMFMKSLHDDIRNEGNRSPVTIKLKKMDEDAILNFIADMQDKTPRY